MIQRFQRNPSISANSDIRELIFIVSEDKIQLTYHTEDTNIASSTREYMKPPNWDEKGAVLSWLSDMHSTFQVFFNLCIWLLNWLKDSLYAILSSLF